MKLKYMQVSILFCLLFVFSLSVSAKTWRVNRNVGVNADFNQLSTAVGSPLVSSGDTVYVEGSSSFYTDASISKRLVIIGTGFFLSENLGLQANVNDSWIASITLDSLASGTHIYGIRTNAVYTNSNTDNILISRCHLSVSPNNFIANSKLSGWVVNKCYLNTFSFSSAGYIFENLQITNCFASNSINLNSSTINGLFRNNTILTNCVIYNSYVANNIFISGGSLTFINSTVRYNISQINNLPAGNNNQVNVTQASLFTLTGSSDGRYQLRAGSPAIAAGETVNGITPDCGVFGTADPYRLSGIPPIPTIYALTVPATIPSSATSMNITLSTRSNN